MSVPFHSESVESLRPTGPESVDIQTISLVESETSGSAIKGELLTALYISFKLTSASETPTVDEGTLVKGESENIF